VFVGKLLKIKYDTSMKMLIHVLVTALALLFVAYVIPGISVENFYAALLASIVLGLLNLIVKPILVILTLPITLLTLGLFLLVINAGLFLLAAQFLDGFYVENLLTALVGSILVSFVSALGNKMLT